MSRIIITHPALGEVSVLQTLRARRISISVRPDGSVRMSMPYNVDVKPAIDFLENKIDWVLKAKERFASKKQVHLISVPFYTRRHSLALDAGPGNSIKISLEESTIVVRHPADKPSGDRDVQQAIRKGIEAAWRKEAKDILPARLARIASEKGFRYKSVTVRNTVSKWGSCSPANDISLSLHLMRLPDHLIDYVLTHELCHTVHKNHGEQFHALLDRLTGGNEKELNKELRKYHTRW